MGVTDIGGLVYSVFGLTVRSEIELPGLYELPGQPPAVSDVVVRLKFASQPSESRRPGFSVGGDSGLLDITNVGRFWITGGREITVEPDPGVSERDLRLFLLGSAFGALLHQRGVIPLHANAIEIGGKAVAFAGSSGAGKSTLAAWFLDQGSRMISDDICAINVQAAEGPLVLGGLPRLRLCSDALIESGRGVEEFDQAFDGVNKYEVPAPQNSGIGPIALGAIYLLARQDSRQSQPEISRLSGVEALDVVVANTYRGSFIKDLGVTSRHLAACLQIVSAVPIYKASRKWGFENFRDQAEELERHAHRLVFSGKTEG
jgi:hypothetical protein